MDLDIPAGVILVKRKQPLQDFSHSPTCLVIKAFFMDFTQLRVLLQAPGVLRLAIQIAVASTGIPPLILGGFSRCEVLPFCVVYCGSSQERQ